MALYSSTRDSKVEIYRVNPIILCLLAVFALALQSYLPIPLPSTRYLDFPLLVVVYYGLTRRNAISGLLVGSIIGIAQDSLTRGPLGMIGIVKTVIGYVTTFLSVRFDVDSRGFRFTISFVSYWLNYLLLVLMSLLLVHSPIPVEIGVRLVASIVNSVIGVLLFSLSDRFRRQT
ncbi:MAG: rod shape-determining protein MreD [Acidobacteria bacterium]|nr:rod shape-determining protein MreD [Acidobacteriota bacterium]